MWLQGLLGEAIACAETIDQLFLPFGTTEQTAASGRWQC
jgi:hypothetical protein